MLNPRSRNDVPIPLVPRQLLLSFLTVPYMRIPLVTSFFAHDDRIHALQSRQLQGVLDASLFEPGAFLPAKQAGLEPIDCPTSAPALLGTAYHLLMNELRHSPKMVLESVSRLLSQAIDLDTGSITASTAVVILYVTRLVSRVDNYIAFVIAAATGTHETMVLGSKDDKTKKTPRQLEIDEKNFEVLVSAQKDLQTTLRTKMHKILEAWYRKLAKECEGRVDDSTLDLNTKRMCNLHAHFVIMYRNIDAATLSEREARTLTTAMVFLQTRHQWNTNLIDNSPDVWQVDESELFDVLHDTRRKLVGYLHSDRSEQQSLDDVMETALLATSKTSARLKIKGAAENRWGFVDGARSRGRFTVFAVRTDNRTPAPPPPVPSSPTSPKANTLDEMMAAATQVKAKRASTAAGATPFEDVQTVLDEDLGVEIDVQLMQLPLRSSHPQALERDIAKLRDIIDIFGKIAMQACILEKSLHRTCYRLVGRSHDLEWWPSPDKGLPPLELFRPYYPEELFPSEKAWIPSIFEPVRRTYLTFPQPLELFMHEDPLPDDATVAHIVGKRPDDPGVWRDIFVYRTLRLVTVYRVESHGRRYYRSLEYTSDARYCLAAMQPNAWHATAAPNALWAGNARRARLVGGTPSTTVTRHAMTYLGHCRRHVVDTAG